MNGKIAEFAGMDLSESGLQPLGEQEMFGITGGVNPVIMAGLYLAAGAAGVLVAGVAAGIAIYYFTH